MSGEGAIPLDPRVLRLWRVRAVLGSLPVLVVATVAAALLVDPVAGVATFVLAAVVAVALAWWWTDLVWRSWRFEVGEGALELRHGVLTRHESTIPFHRVQAGPLERRLGLTTFVLRTASASSDSAVPGIDAAHAEELRARILALVGTGDAV